MYEYVRLLANGNKVKLSSLNLQPTSKRKTMSSGGSYLLGLSLEIMLDSLSLSLKHKGLFVFVVEDLVCHATANRTSGYYRGAFQLERLCGRALLVLTPSLS